MAFRQKTLSKAENESIYKTIEYSTTFQTYDNFIPVWPKEISVIFIIFSNCSEWEKDYRMRAAKNCEY
jgi:hypothetical protein